MRKIDYKQANFMKNMLSSIPLQAFKPEVRARLLHLKRFLTKEVKLIDELIDVETIVHGGEQVVVNGQLTETYKFKAFPKPEGTTDSAREDLMKHLSRKREWEAACNKLRERTFEIPEEIHFTKEEFDGIAEPIGFLEVIELEKPLTSK